MIVFDCERMKHPNTGLYYYTLHLANALAVEAAKRGRTDLAFYSFKKNRAELPGGVRFKNVGPLDRAMLFDPRVKLWHTTSQLSHYQPKGCKKILTIHDLNFLYERKALRSKKRSLSILMRNMRGADAIVAISEFTKRDILEHIPVADKPVEVILNGCNFYTGPLTAPAGMGDHPFLFAVGTVMPKKNFHVLPALLKGTDLHLYIAGEIVRHEYARQIMDEARRWGVEDRVHIMGPITDAEKEWCLAHCTAFCHPSIAEGFGLPVLEAMHHGKPVFCSDHTSLPEVGGDMAYYFNHQFDPEAMQAELRAGLDDFAAGGKAPAQLIAHAHSFSWEKAAAQHWDLYEKALRK